MTQLVETSRILHFSTNWWCLMDMLCVKSLKFEESLPEM